MARIPRSSLVAVLAAATLSLPATAGAAPSADDVAVQTPAGAPVSVTLRATDTLDSPLDFSIDTGPSHGSLGAIDPPACTFQPALTTCTATVAYTPGDRYSGADSLRYVATSPG